MIFRVDQINAFFGTALIADLFVLFSELSWLFLVFLIGDCDLLLLDCALTYSNRTKLCSQRHWSKASLQSLQIHFLLGLGCSV